MTDKLFLGLDGGQSRTTAMIGDGRGRVLGVGLAGPCNHASAGEGRAKLEKAVRESVRQACEAAGMDFAGVRFGGACLGFSGGPEDKEEIVKALVPAERVKVTDDAWIALVGATGGEAGLIVIAGTGSIALGRNAAGRKARAGGWGYVFGDEGSAFDITRKALRASLCYEEGWGPATSLRGRLLDACRATTANELLHRFYTPEFTRPQIARLAKLVDEAAEAGDAVAASILVKAAGELAALAEAVRKQLFRQREGALICPIGGVFRSAMVRENFSHIAGGAAGNTVAEAKHGPAAGALLEAYALVGLHVPLEGAPEEKP
jgi:glucosamine kinase